MVTRLWSLPALHYKAEQGGDADIVCISPREKAYVIDVNLRKTLSGRS